MASFGVFGILGFLGALSVLGVSFQVDCEIQNTVYKVDRRLYNGGVLGVLSQSAATARGGNTSMKKFLTSENADDKPL
jgi:hypothetical protein